MFSPTIVGSGLQAYQLLSQTRERQQEAFDNSPQIARDVSGFKEKIASVQSGEELVQDRALLRVALGAFGLDADIDNPIFIQQVLDSDLLDPQSPANRLTDPRYLALAQTFGFNSPAGPQLNSSTLGDGLDAARTPDDLLSNKRLLDIALDRFGLKDDANNTFFLQRILESDVSDPKSFVNQVGQAKYVAFAEAFDFSSRTSGNSKVAAFVDAFEGKIDGLSRADQLLRDPDLVKAVVDVFDLPNDSPRVLERTLNSDPTDPNSFVNTSNDKRYLAVAEAFRFGLPDPNLISDPADLISNTALLEDVLARFELSNQGADFFTDLLNSDLSDPSSFANQAENSAFLAFANAFQTKTIPDAVSPAKAFIEAVKDKTATLTEGSNVIFDLEVFDATLDFFALSERKSQASFIQRVLDSDLTSPQSLASLNPDTRLSAMAGAFGFVNSSGPRALPEGFADEITTRYQERQFDVAVGEFDPNMRLALSVERELDSILARGGTTDSLWFRVIGSPPLRQVFETVFQLPSAFVNADITQQLDELKTRSQAIFGTDDVRELAQGDQLENVRRRFLAFSELSASPFGSANPQSVALALLSGG